MRSRERVLAVFAHQEFEIMKPGGGYILSASHDAILEETPVENVLAMFDAGREFGAYAPPSQAMDDEVSATAL